MVVMGPQEKIRLRKRSFLAQDVYNEQTRALVLFNSVVVFS